jgi:diadenosine tetraphosphatase ApaH/serine/threonine PP2A family protein phosphatase
MFAIISDIHSNLEALTAVLADIERRGAKPVYCLGDLVGYGPNPVECVELAFNWKLVILGNHDQAVTFRADGFSKHAERAINWTRQAIAATRRPELAEFLAARPLQHRDGDFQFVHGSPRYPTTEYVFPEDVRNAEKMTRIRSLVDRYCFCGHTHVPGDFVEPHDAGARWQFYAPEVIDSTWTLNKRKTLVNVGAVGQPRDKNWRACYATVDGWTVTFHRVEYDVETTVAKIRAVPDLLNALGERLREGV